MSIDETYDDLDELPAPPRKEIPAADRELLELAARALGAVRVEDVDGEEWLILHFADGTETHGWNALLFYSDTFELAARLGLLVDFNSRAAMEISRTGESPSDWHGGTDDEPAAASARAVVSAAAEIGKDRNSSR